MLISRWRDSKTLKFFSFSLSALKKIFFSTMNMYFLYNENKFPSSGPSKRLLLGVQECTGKLNQVLLALRHCGKGHQPL